jgi:hypothetical protein
MRKILLVLALLYAVPVSTQGKPPPVEHSGFSGSLGLAPTRFSIGGGEEMGRVGVGATLGVRLRPFSRLPRLRFTPHVAFSATHFAGIGEDDATAFSSLDAGLRVSYRAGRHLRPFVAVRTGNRFAERMESGALINYSGSGRGWGAGIEIPVTPLGRGPELALYRLSGRFDTTEAMRREAPVDVEYEAWSVSLSWSGPFTGSTPPWR